MSNVIINKNNIFKVILEAAKKARMLEQHNTKLLHTPKNQCPVAVKALEQVLHKKNYNKEKK